MANLAFTWKSAGQKIQALDQLRDYLARQNRMLGFKYHQILSNSETLLEWETRDFNVNT
jgi:hypothetical protein